MGIYQRYLQKYWLPITAAIVCVTLESFCDLLAPTLMAKIINLGINNESLSEVLRWGLLMLFVTLIGAVFAVSRNILASRVSQRVGADLRYDLFRKILHFSEAGADRLENSSLITRMTNDVQQIVQFVNGMMRVFMKAPVTCIGSIILASLLNFRLSLVVYAVVAVVGTLIFLSMYWSYPRYGRLQKAVDRVNAVVQEYLIGIRLVKAFGTYDEEIKRFDKANDTMRERATAAEMIITRMTPLLNLTVGIGTAVVIYWGSELFRVERADIGDITAFVIYMSQILTALLTMTNVFNIFVRTRTSSARIMEVIEGEEDFSGGINFANTESIVFDRVSFSYPSGSGIPAIRDLSFGIEQGKSLAIIGPTGSGKSTIAWLLLRFYDVDHGRITIGGQDIKKWDVKALRKKIALVSQKAILFSGTVCENLKWGKLDATEEELKNAVERAYAGFVYNMSEGFESIIGHSGVNLSGGQKQRLAIARGFMKDAPIMVLDDATSALDAVTEAKVRDELVHPHSERITILITQRCTTAMFADNILVIENGVSVGFGTHRELMESCQTYQDIFHSQIESEVG